MTSATPGAGIMYTTDTSAPVAPPDGNGTLYTGPITLNTTTSFRAFAFRAGWANSAMVSGDYTILGPPTIVSIWPGSAAAGDAVTITGAGFGAVPGSGTVWLGSAPGTAVSWRDTQIVATVATNAVTGSARVQQGGMWSNAVPFTVITASVSNVTPTAGVAGTEVTIAGTGFGAQQGIGQVWLGTALGTVKSWSDTQIVALVAAGSQSGYAQVLQNGVWSNAIAFTINGLQIASVTPAAAPTGTQIAIDGTGFGTAQAGGSVVLGGAASQIVSWSDTEIQAVVSPAALTGVVRVQQNGTWSNAVPFTVVGAGAAARINPQLLNMAIGDTHTIQALGANNQPLTGLTWTSSDTNVVSLSTDDPPVLTALAIGHVTISAGGASADVTVSPTLALGTILWSNPGNGSGVYQIVPGGSECDRVGSLACPCGDRLPYPISMTVQ